MSGSPRRFFQIHLSTAVVMLLVAGVLVWKNLQDPRYVKFQSTPQKYTTAMIEEYWYGWPYECRVERVRSVVSSSVEGPFNGGWLSDGVIYNSLIGFSILLCVWVLCELPVRRRASEGEPIVHRPRFLQIHLSTTVVSMFVAGVLLWANVRQQQHSYEWFRLDYDRFSWGWPFEYKVSTFITYLGIVKSEELALQNILHNALIALVILVSVCVACEWRIRRRAVPLQKSP